MTLPGLRRAFAAVLTAALLGSNLPAARADAEAGRPPGKPEKIRSTFTPLLSPDVPDRCPAERFVFDTTGRSSLGFSQMLRPVKPGEDPDLMPIDLILYHEIRTIPFVITLFYKKTDWYRRRDELIAKIENRLLNPPTDAPPAKPPETFDPKDRPHAEGNYALLLIYLGEYKRAVERFAEGAGPGGPYAEHGIVNYALANAYFRLGDYKKSMPYAEKAHALLEKAGSDALRDTRWQIMMSALGLYGADWHKHFKCKDCSAKWVKKLFPAKDASGLPFEDVTDEMGIPRWGGYGDTGFVDLDNDGWDDLVWTQKFMEPMLFRNAQGQGFERLAQEKLPPHPACNQLYFYGADYDNDGKTDLVHNCCNFDGPGPTSLWKNMGDLKFEDVGKKSGLDTVHSESVNECWSDFDLDGNVDIVIQDRGSGRPRLHHNNGDGTFSDWTDKSGIGFFPETGYDGQWAKKGIKSNFGMGCAAGDYNGDRYPDLFLQGWGWRKLFRNKGDGAFADVTGEAGIPDGRNSNGYYSFFFDYDNDGKMDILAGQYVSLALGYAAFAPACLCSNILSPAGIGEQEQAGATELYRNNGDGTFTNMADTFKFIPFGVMGYGHGDWDNSGRQSLVFGAGGPYFQQVEPFLFYHNNPDGTFTNVTPWTLLGLWGKGHGTAFGDYDHDGNLDLALNNGGFEPGDLWPSLLLHNTGSPNHFVEVHLKAGPGTNKSAIGARVWVRTGRLKQLQELASGTGFGANSLSLHFGLARNAKIDEIVVEWPNRKLDKTILKDVPADQAIEIDETDGSYRELWRPATKSAAR